ncbi:MAG: copper amine oxidase N-terminal domain-containing protein [Firmicutes bacterium]|nr:copper amine oxidase N-terminal domain-containing protein [Bacillota bacterium]
MKKNIKKYKKVLITALLTLLAVGSVSAFDGGKTVKVVFNAIKLNVDGKNLNKETLLYEGITYIPLRSAAEALGAKVEYDEEEKTAYITSRKEEAVTEGSKTERDRPLFSEANNITVQMSISDKSSGYRTIDAKVNNFTGFTMKKCVLTYRNNANSKTVVFKYDNPIKNGSFFNAKAIVSTVTDTNDLQLVRSEYTLEENGKQRSITYETNTGSYTVK